MASNSINPTLECEDGTPEEHFAVTDLEFKILGEAFGEAHA